MFLLFQRQGLIYALIILLQLIYIIFIVQVKLQHGENIKLQWVTSISEIKIRLSLQHSIVNVSQASELYRQILDTKKAANAAFYH